MSVCLSGTCLVTSVTEEDLETTEGEEVDLLAAFLELLLLFLLVVHLPSRQLQEAPVLVTGRVTFCNGQGLLDSL